MVVSATNEFLDIAKRKIYELREKNTQFKIYCEQLKTRRDTPKKTTDHTSRPQAKTQTFEKGDSCTAACVGQSVLDILARRPQLFKFKEVLTILGHCNRCKSHRFVEDVLRKYAIVITGFPRCPEEDLDLAVFFFIEDVFGIQPKIEFCTKLIEVEEFDMTGVVFESTASKQHISKKLKNIQGTGIEIDTDFDIAWIEDHFKPADSD